MGQCQNNEINQCVNAVFDPNASQVQQVSTRNVNIVPYNTMGNEPANTNEQVQNEPDLLDVSDIHEKDSYKVNEFYNFQSELSKIKRNKNRILEMYGKFDEVNATNKNNQGDDILSDPQLNQKINLDQMKIECKECGENVLIKHGWVRFKCYQCKNINYQLDELE